MTVVQLNNISPGSEQPPSGPCSEAHEPSEQQNALRIPADFRSSYVLEGPAQV